MIDNTLPEGMATVGYDDEGTKSVQLRHHSQRHARRLRDEQRHRARYRTREQRLRARAELGVRADDPHVQPEPAPRRRSPFDNLFDDVKDGIYMESNRSWSIDDHRLNFQFGCEIAWEVKNGKRGRMLKNPTYAGMTPQFWNSCDAIGDEGSWVAWGTPNCGKGEPMQTGTHRAVRRARALSQRGSRSWLPWIRRHAKRWQRAFSSLSTADQTEVIRLLAATPRLTRFTHNAVHQNVAASDTRRIAFARSPAAARALPQRTCSTTQRSRGRSSAPSRWRTLAPEDPALAAAARRRRHGRRRGRVRSRRPPRRRRKSARRCATRSSDVAEQRRLLVRRVSHPRARTASPSPTRSGAIASFDGTDCRRQRQDERRPTPPALPNAMRYDCRRIDGASDRRARRSQSARIRVAAKRSSRASGPSSSNRPRSANCSTYLGDHFSAQAFDEGSSFLSDGLGSSVLRRENVTLLDDYAHPLAPGMPFDYEAHAQARFARRKRRGETSSPTAIGPTNCSARNTGHALPAPNAYGPQALQLVVAARQRTPR